MEFRGRQAGNMFPGHLDMVRSPHPLIFRLFSGRPVLLSHASFMSPDLSNQLCAGPKRTLSLLVDPVRASARKPERKSQVLMFLEQKPVQTHLHKVPQL